MSDRYKVSTGFKGYTFTFTGISTLESELVVMSQNCVDTPKLSQMYYNIKPCTDIMHHSEGTIIMRTFKSRPIWVFNSTRLINSTFNSFNYQKSSSGHLWKERVKCWGWHGCISPFSFGLSSLLSPREVWHNQVVSLWNSCTSQSRFIRANQRSM